MKRHFDIYVIYGITSFALAIFFGALVHAYFTDRHLMLTRIEKHLVCEEITKQDMNFKSNPHKAMETLFPKKTMEKIAEESAKNKLLGKFLFKHLTALKTYYPLFIIKFLNETYLEQIVLTQILKIYIVRALQKKDFDYETYERIFKDSKL